MAVVDNPRFEIVGANEDETGALAISIIQGQSGVGGGVHDESRKMLDNSNYLNLRANLAAILELVGQPTSLTTKSSIVFLGGPGTSGEIDCPHVCLAPGRPDFRITADYSGGQLMVEFLDLAGLPLAAPVTTALHGARAKSNTSLTGVFGVTKAQVKISYTASAGAPFTLYGLRILEEPGTP